VRRAAHLTRARLAAVLLGSLALLVVVVALAPLVGVRVDADGRHLELLDLFHAFAGGRGNADAEIFFLARLPRVLAGAVAGAGLASAGVAFQALLRNPLAEPYTLGVSQGATLGAVLGIRLGLAAALGGSAVPVLAFVGGLAAVLSIWRLARVGGALPSATLLLAGITLGVICSAATMLLQSTASFSEGYRILRWMMGGIEWIRYGDLAAAAIAVAVALVALLARARDLNALAAGSDAAASVGVNVDRATLIGHGAASLMVGAVIAVAGPIGFVGLLVPHALRALVGPDHRVLLPAAAIGGAIFVIVCDTIARVALAPVQQFPVGVITALLGGPFFLVLLMREKGRGRLWG
jgi:iron complex transport system permease protein